MATRFEFAADDVEAISTALSNTRERALGRNSRAFALPIEQLREHLCLADSPAQLVLKSTFTRRTLLRRAADDLAQAMNGNEFCDDEAKLDAAQNVAGALYALPSLRALVDPPSVSQAIDWLGNALYLKLLDHEDPPWAEQAQGGFDFGLAAKRGANARRNWERALPPPLQKQINTPPVGPERTENPEQDVAAFRQALAIVLEEDK